MSKRIWIPEMPEDDIRRLAETIKPIVRFAEGKEGLFRSEQGFPYRIEPVDLFKTAYTYDPKPTTRFEGELVPLRDITTYHSYGYYGCFKPSVAEVLAQIPDDIVDQVVAFEIVWSPETAADLRGEAVNAGYHEATTRLYTEKSESETDESSD